MGTIDTIIFDIGGVLVGPGQRANILGQYGLEWTPREHEQWQQYKLGRATEREYWERTLEGTPMAGREAEVARYAREVYRNATPGGALPFVKPLHAQGYRIAILSNHATEWSRPYLAKHGLHERCDPILISAEIKLAKPDPDIYAYTLWALGKQDAPETCVFIDDKEENIAAARAAGIQGILYTGAETLEEELRKRDIHPPREP